MKFVVLSLLASCLAVLPDIGRRDLHEDERKDTTLPFSKVVVLMMENQSYDHIFGFVPGVGKLTGKEGNYDLNGNFIRVAPGCHHNDPDHPHDFGSAISMLYWPNHNVTVADPQGGGYVITNFLEGVDIEQEKEYMQTYDDEAARLPALQTLAKNFVVCDRWFASLPGPTVPNRLFVHLASSGGYCGGEWVTGEEHVPPELTSIYEVLEKNGKTWGIYAIDYSLQLPSQDIPFVRNHPNNKLGVWQFYQDISLGKQPDYSFIIPSMYISQHPGNGDSAMKAGDDLIHWVYNTIRQNERAWLDTLFIITYDEWGGWYDSVQPSGTVPAPPAVDPASPKWPPGPNPTFEFNVLGSRVPGVLVSPWLDAQVQSNVLEHTSVLTTLKILFDLQGPGPDGFLTVRDHYSSWLLQNVTIRSTPRTDLFFLEEGYSPELKEKLRNFRF